MTHTADTLLKAVEHGLDGPPWRRFDDIVHQSRASAAIQWPAWCYVPMAASYAIVSEGKQLGPEQAVWVSYLHAAALWRPSRSVYRFAPELRDALVETPVSGELPADVLQGLPEWCVYVEHATHIFGVDIVGFWAHLEHDANDQRGELRLLLHRGDPPALPVAIHLGGSLEDGVTQAAAEAMAQGLAAGVELVSDTHALKAQADALAPLVSLVLYLCIDAPDIAGERPKKVRARPTKKRPTPTLKGASGVVVREVGGEIAEQLRRASSERSAHIRSAHWHTYWVGTEREGTRRRELRWLSPMLVGASAPRSDT